jgi:hypothetical protein
MVNNSDENEDENEDDDDNDYYCFVWLQIDSSVITGLAQNSLRGKNFPLAKYWCVQKTVRNSITYYNETGEPQKKQKKQQV